MAIRPRYIVIALIVVIVVVLVYFLFLRKAPVLTAVTWSGSYGRAQASALFLPYGQKTGVNVHIAQYDGGLDELRKQVADKKYAWDVVDLELPDAVAACREGLLEHVDVTKLSTGENGEPAASDFVQNAIGPCWVGSVVYSQLIAYAPTRFGGAHPITLSDFFDMARFPGPRAMKSSSAKFNLELALLADGVAPQDIYHALSTEQGVARALAKLNTIRSSIVWWTRSTEPAAMLQDGRAAFATILNGDIYDAAVHHRGMGTIWDRQLYELDVFGVPKNDPKRDMAMDFMRFATSASNLAGVADWVPYGPARRSAVKLVGKNPELGIAMRGFLPTAPEHFGTAFAVDDRWWQANGSRIAPLWEAWVNR
ncbi:MAG TPA: extracellular solute-binding protein [Rhizomicrobium sp.]|nr:extracellular solute-binding protein [Rhizomicrobium sp.]